MVHRESLPAVLNYVPQNQTPPTQKPPDHCTRLVRAIRKDRILLALVVLVACGPYITPTWHRLVFWDLSLHHAAALAVLAGLLLAFRRIAASTLTSVAVIALVATSAPAVTIESDLPTTSGANPPIEIVWQNALGSHNPPDQFLALVGDQQLPDVLVVGELTDDWDAALRLHYPHATSVPAPYEGIGIYSEFPMRDAEVFGEPFPLVRAVVVTTSGEFGVVGIHPPPPVTAEYAEHRRAQVEAIPGIVDALGSAVSNDASEPPILVLGDFNTTRRNPLFRRMAREAKLGFVPFGGQLLGMQIARRPTWPEAIVRWGLDLDHILITDSVQLVSSERLEDVGSDHRGVSATIALP